MKTSTILASLALAAGAAQAQPAWLAHRGLAQDYSREGLGRQTCTADRMRPPRHGYLENTIASMEAAFAFGAEMVEFDIHPTTDGEFVVFHDWTIDCRTEGHGVTREQALATLKSLDVGYGYTADGGKTFPFRGKFKGAMPTWAEVMAAFPRQRFLVNIKSNDPREAALIEAYVARHRIDTSRLAFYGGERPIAALRERWPAVPTMSKATLKECAWKHVLLGWTGYVPEACRHTIVFVPVNYQSWAWGWPEGFLARMRAAGSEVTVIGPVDRTDVAGTTNVDDPATLARIAPGYAGLVSTDAIDVMGPAAQRPGVTAVAAEDAAWTEPMRPFRIAGNVHYVGTRELAAYAIRTSAGTILLDTGVFQTVPALLQSMRTLGLDPMDVKVILTSHAHYDHVGGVAAVKRLTGATLVASAPDAEAMARGGVGDFAFGDRFPFPAVKADRLVADGEAVELGDTRLVARLTPGHTRGCTTWTMQVQEAGRTFDVLFGCSYTAPGYKLVDNAAYPGIVDDYRATFAKLAKLPCDIQLASHASFFDMERRHAALQAGNALAFVDPAGCRAFIQRSAARFEEEVARQRAR